MIDGLRAIGHRIAGARILSWYIGTHVEDVSPEEITKASSGQTKTTAGEIGFRAHVNS